MFNNDRMGSIFESELARLEGVLLSIKQKLNEFGVEKNLLPAHVDSLQLMKVQNVGFLNDHLRTYLDILNASAARSEWGIDNEVKLLTLALKKYGVHAPRGYEQFIQIGDAIEIHDIDGIQIYRNLETFSYCSFSLAEMLCYNWQELYQRPKRVVQRLCEEIEGMSIDPSQVKNFSDLQHVITENCDDPLTLLIDLKSMIPLKTDDTGEYWGAMTVKKATIIAEGFETTKFGYL